MTEQRKAALAKAAAQYRKAVKRADDIKKQATDELAAAMREAYSEGEGLKKADILRATGHVWSRTWVDHALSNKPTRPSE